MELKLQTEGLSAVGRQGLNRTFYGIETFAKSRYSPQLRGLNRTFYGIETWQQHRLRPHCQCLNRTFYGIETHPWRHWMICAGVLIVPFMELKHFTDDLDADSLES